MPVMPELSKTMWPARGANASLNAEAGVIAKGALGAAVVSCCSAGGANAAMGSAVREAPVMRNPPNCQATPRPSMKVS